MNIKAPKLISVNSFVLSSILVIFIVSFSSLASLRAPLLVLQFSFFYFLIIYKHKKIIANKSLIAIFLLTVFIVIQSMVFQGNILTIFQSIAMVSFLFFASQIALTESQYFYDKDQYKTLSKTLLILLPFFLISFTRWSDLREPGLFQNPNITSHLSVMLLPLILLGLDKNRYKVLAIILVILVTLITASRSSTLALFLSLFAYAFVTKFPKSHFITLFLLLGTILVFSFYSVDIATWVSSSFSSVTSASDSRLLNTGYNGRDVIMQLAMDRFKAQPIIGLGFDGVKFEIEGHELGTHNGLIETLIKFGIVGTTIFTAFFLSLIWMTSKHNSVFKPATVMSLAAILSLSTNSSTFLLLNYLFIYSVLLAYLGYGIKSQSESEAFA